MATVCDYCGKTCGQYSASISVTGLDGDDNRLNIGHIHFHTQKGTAPDQEGVSCLTVALDRLQEPYEDCEPTWESGELERGAVQPPTVKARPAAEDRPERVRVRPEDRERVVLELLGDDRLTVNELWRRAYAAGWDLGEGKARVILRDLLEAGQVERRPEPRGRGGKAIRYRWNVKTRLEGPIVELERAFRDGGQS